jgi:hypothetical protein
MAGTSPAIPSPAEAPPMSLETKISTHYTHSGLIAVIDAILRKAGEDPAALNVRIPRAIATGPR